MMYLNWKKVLTRIKRALDNQRPFSMVRVGDGENIVMAQKSVWSIKKVLRERWAKKANKGRKGVRLPNIKIRNQMIRSIRKANIVGILPPGDRRTKAPKRLKRPLTNRIFRYYRLKPRYSCDAVVNRFFAGRQEFWEVLRGRRVLLITKHALKLKEVLQTDPYRMEIAGTIVFSHYMQMNNALQQAKKMKDHFDIALISCGVNSVILAPEIARLTGKVAIDFGKGPHVVLKKKNAPEESNSLNNRIRNKNSRKSVYSSKYTPGLVSIVILTHNALSSTMECIDSINRNTPEKYQLVLVDNGSEDGTAAYFKSISGATVIVNEVNKGHAEALNQGLLASKGEFIVLLKNDSVVTKDWLPRMIWWLQNDSSIGIVGVRSNLAERKQKVEKVPHNTLGEMESFAENWSEKHNKQGFKADELSTVCMMFHQNLAAKIGIFDKRFDLKYGFDDFFIRTMIAGKKLWVANDIFIHHVGRSSSVSNTEQKIQLDNKRKFDEKWKISQWENYTGIAQREKPFD